jgi:hypothetical protein
MRRLVPTSPETALKTPESRRLDRCAEQALQRDARGGGHDFALASASLPSEASDWLAERSAEAACSFGTNSSPDR